MLKHGKAAINCFTNEWVWLPGSLTVTISAKFCEWAICNKAINSVLYSSNLHVLHSISIRKRMKWGTMWG